MAAAAEKKMIPVNLDGPEELLDALLVKGMEMMTFEGLDAKPFHDEDANPYAGLLERMIKIAGNAQIELGDEKIAALTAGKGEIAQFVADFDRRFEEMQTALLRAQTALSQEQNLLIHLRHLEALNIRFDRLFAMKYVKVRFGRLMADSRAKLSYYGEHDFLFFPFSAEGDSIWGVYFAPNEVADEVDNIFNALYFERVYIPDGVAGTPAEARAALEKQCAEDAERLDRLSEQFSRLIAENRARFLRLYNEARFLCRMYERRRYASVFSDRFYLTAFVYKDRMRALEQAVDQLAGIRLEPMRRRFG